MWFVLLTSFFTPSSQLYNSPLDGAWQFGEVVSIEEPITAKEVFLENNQQLYLNNSETPAYLVNNRYDYQFSINNSPSWLEITYQPWSSEELLGFDDPLFVIFLNEQLIFKQLLSDCCQPQQQQIYLGKLVGNQQLNFFAGDMGDLEQPSGVVIDQFSILTALNSSAPKSATSKQTSLVDTQIEPTSYHPQPTTVVSSNDPITNSPGEVLGAVDDQPSMNSNWLNQLRYLVNHPWSLPVMWLAVTVIVIFMLHIRDRKE